MKKKNQPTGAVQVLNAKTSPTYKFRAECATDAQLVRAMLRPWLQSWKEEQSPMNYKGKLHYLGDTEVTVTLVAGAPSYGELLWLIDSLHNCHVVGQTFALVQRYTTERSSRRAFAEPAVKPSNEVVLTALDAVQARECLLELEHARAQYIAKLQSEVVEQGDAWTAPAEGVDQPGWLFAVTEKSTGLVAVRSVAAIEGDMSALIHGHEQPRARLHTLAN